MLSGDSGQGESICTPRSVSKRLFGTGGSSSKRNLFGRTMRAGSKEAEMSEDSDLGPMSPLGLSDRSSSSRENSPCRSFVSLPRTPEKSPRQWDRLRPSISRPRSESCVKTFDSLRMLTKVARSSPNRKIHQNSPKSLSSTPTRKTRVNKSSRVISTPEHELALLFEDAIVPETPRRGNKGENYEDGDCIAETPEKSDGRSERKLVTPLSCVSSNEIAIPRLHRRKSLCLLDNEVTRSPEDNDNALKRRSADLFQSVGSAKIPRIDEANSLIPRARASLFPETKKDAHTSKEITCDFTLSTKTFYKSSIERRGRSTGNVVRGGTVESTKKRHSLPSFVSNRRRREKRRSTIRRGEMNAGVRHGIKRPRSKRHVSRVEAFKMEKQKMTRPKNENRENVKINEDHSAVLKTFGDTAPRPCPPSPVIDPNKRFFKTNRTLKPHRLATVTVNDKIKLKVSDGKIVLNDKRSHQPRNPHKRQRLEEMSFDTTDLTVDEPSLDSSVEKRNIVDGILKVLEDDWADDDYDTMETLTVLSPIRNVETAANASHNVTMSPASVLTNMTLSMNIKEPAAAKSAPENTNSTVKLYPLFDKGFSSNIADQIALENKKKSDRGLKRPWQTSAKGGGAEDQYQIDAGQKRFGATTCMECGIVYQRGDPEDENAHLNYHNNVKTLRFNGWKQERVVLTDPLTKSRIIRIEPGDPKQCWKKVEQVLATVDNDLGLAEMEVANYADKQIYFYVRDRTILGVLVAESIKVAHRMIPELADLNCCSAEETPAKCGVNVIWTSMSHRRQKIATKMLDTLRATFFFGYIMSLEDIAFSMPTLSGKIFAENYTKTCNFKVYS